MVNNITLLTSENEEILPDRSVSIIDNNTVMDNFRDTLPTPEDELAHSQVCHPVNSGVYTLLSLPNTNCVPEPADEQENNSNIDKLRSYVQSQCYEGSKMVSLTLL